MLAVVGAAVGPRAEQVGTMRVALVQGGGVQGAGVGRRRAQGVRRHLQASRRVEPPVDLVVWPEDVVDYDSLADDREGDELADRPCLNATLIAGVVEDDGPHHFLNASVAGPTATSSTATTRSTVPFGEYVPLRSLVEPFGGRYLPSRDAVIGDHPPCWTHRPAS